MNSIKGLSKNSKEINQGDIYFCFEGAKSSGYDYIDEALKNGAVKIVGERNIDLQEYEQVDNVNEALIKYAKEIYDNPQDKLSLIGITGTDGKTSTALLINNFLNKLSKSSYVGTNGFIVGDEELDYTDFTTPFADKFFKYLNRSVKEDSKYFVSEVSSHALAQNRLGDILFDVCILTNITPEHLDYHKTMEHYYESKKSIFNKLKDQGFAIINIDDEYGAKMAQEINNKNILTISETNKAATIYISNVDLTIEGTTFTITYENKDYKINSSLLADFNVYNLTEAIACLIALGYEIEDIINYTKDIFIPGRLELIKSNDRLIIIDFAHTADAINKVMTFIKQVSENRKIHVLTGSAGGRDSQKRSKMGEYASKYADFLYLTEDDPRDESVKEINNQIKKGIINKECQVFEIENRKEAIRKMLSCSGKGDILILFGKGVMKYMYYDGYKEEYIEKEEIIKALKELDDKFNN